VRFARAILRPEALRAQESGVGLGDRVRMGLGQAIQAQHDFGDRRVVGEDQGSAAHPAQYFARIGGVVAELAAVEQLPAVGQCLRGLRLGQMAKLRQIHCGRRGRGRKDQR
jgi:hypothetical protein